MQISKKKYHDMCIEAEMSGEFMLGMQGNFYYDGVRLASLCVHEQLKLAQKAGVTIFGPVVNANTNRSIPWNLSRAITFMKACGEISRIPIHVNIGIGVGAGTVTDHPQSATELELDRFSRTAPILLDRAALHRGTTETETNSFDCVSQSAEASLLEEPGARKPHAGTCAGAVG